MMKEKFKSLFLALVVSSDFSVPWLLGSQENKKGLPRA